MYSVITAPLSMASAISSTIGFVTVIAVLRKHIKHSNASQVDVLES